MLEEECPKERCFFWIPPGGFADMSGEVFYTLDESFEKGDWVEFRFGGCSCAFGSCSRIYKDGDNDYFEPIK